MPVSILSLSGVLPKDIEAPPITSLRLPAVAAKSEPELQKRLFDFNGRFFIGPSGQVAGADGRAVELTALDPKVQRP